MHNWLKKLDTQVYKSVLVCVSVTVNESVWKKEIMREKKKHKFLRKISYFWITMSNDTRNIY